MGIAGRTVIGGYVYRGKQIPDLQGTYVFGDYLGPQATLTPVPANTQKIFTLNYDGTTASNPQDITSQLFPTSVGSFSIVNPSSFGEDANGELYITDISAGSVYQIVPITPNVKIDKVTKSANGHVVVQGSGVPFKLHNVQVSPDLLQAFVTIGTATAGGDGSFQFDDANAPGFTKRFYRVTYP